MNHTKLEHLHAGELDVVHDALVQYREWLKAREDYTGKPVNGQKVMHCDNLLADVQKTWANIQEEWGRKCR